MICSTCGTANADNVAYCIGCKSALPGAPQGQQGWGSGPQAQGGWGAPAQPGYGPPPQAGWGAPPGYGNAYPPPGQYGMAPAGYGGMVQTGPRGTTRNPALVLFFSFFCCYGAYVAWVMLYELQAFTQDENFKPWKLFIPFYNLYFWHSEVPDQVTKAKRMAGCRNPYANGFYEHANVALYSLAKDLNDVWDPNGTGR